MLRIGGSTTSKKFGWVGVALLPWPTCSPSEKIHLLFKFLPFRPAPPPFRLRHSLLLPLLLLLPGEEGLLINFGSSKVLVVPPPPLSVFPNGSSNFACMHFFQKMGNKELLHCLFFLPSFFTSRRRCCLPASFPALLLLLLLLLLTNIFPQTGNGKSMHANAAAVCSSPSRCAIPSFLNDNKNEGGRLKPTLAENIEDDRILRP